MAPKVDPKCIECQNTESMLWRAVGDGSICQKCYEQREGKEKIQEAGDGNKTNAESTKELKDTKQTETFENKSTLAMEEKRLRKSTRATRFKMKTPLTTTTTTINGSNATVKAQGKGRNRRNIFKKVPLKLPSIHATTRTVQSTFNNGYYFQVGDIVSLIDDEENVYYAQIRGLLVDDYCEKSAFLTWLIPTQASPDPNSCFDPPTYLIGHDEEFSRKLSCLQFVMHAPSDYYFDRTTPFPRPDIMENDTKSRGFLWTNLPAQERKQNSS